MAGLNYGNKYRRVSKQILPNEEGVFYSEVLGKYIARVINTGNNRKFYKYTTLIQNTDEKVVTDEFNKYIQQRLNNC